MEILKPNILINSGDPYSDTWPTYDTLITRLPGSFDLLNSRLYELVHNNIRDNSLAFVIVPSPKDDKLLPYRVAIEFSRWTSLTFIDSIVWVKDKFIPIQGDKRLNNVYETVLLFAKGKNYHLDREKLLAYAAPSSDKKCIGNIWNVKLDEREVLPKELVRYCLIVQDLLPNSLIVDPFIGKGQATVAIAKEMGHSLCGWTV